MKTAYLLIGGNSGDRKDFLSRARTCIASECGKLLKQSSLYETAAWGLENQPPFLNQAVEIETGLSAEDLLHTLLRIETSLGRTRDEKYGPRTIDIDILFYADAIIDTAALRVPHPEVQNRRFALVPMTEIAADLVHPLLHKTVTELLNVCPDTLDVHKIWAGDDATSFILPPLQ